MMIDHLLIVNISKLHPCIDQQGFYNLLITQKTPKSSRKVYI